MYAPHWDDRCANSNLYLSGFKFAELEMSTLRVHSTLDELMIMF